MRRRQDEIGDELEKITGRLEFLRDISEHFSGMSDTGQFGLFLVMCDIVDQLQVIQKEIRCAA